MSALSRLHSRLAPQPAAPGERRPANPSFRLTERATSAPWLACLLLSLLWFGATAGLRPLALPDEGRYVGVALEMLRSGDWSVPTLDGMPFFHKPPLFYWLSAASMEVFGVNAFAARVPSVIASALALTGLFSFLRRWCGTRQAWATAIVLATTPLAYAASQYANLDMLVAACISGTILLAAQAILSREAGAPYRNALAAAFAVAALGVLAKGLIGAVLPTLVLIVWGLLTRRLGKILTMLLWPTGWLLFLAIVAPWFVAMQARFPDFFHYFFVVQHFERFAAGGFNNVQPFWFYPAALLALTLPWSPWLAIVLRRRHWRQADAIGLRSLMGAWLAAITLFFSIPASKPVGYILPVLPALAFLCVDGMRAIGAVQWPRICAAFSAVACVVVLIVLHFHPPGGSTADLGRQLQAARQADEPVYFISYYYYDVPFYSGMEQPARIVDGWAPADLARDSWRRELRDAERFAPAGTPRTLMRPEELDAALCSAPGSWLLGPLTLPRQYKVLEGIQPLASAHGVGLWHIRPSTAEEARQALHCKNAV